MHKCVLDFFIFFISLSFFLVSHVSAQVYYVRENGNDANSCSTIQNPAQTTNAARQIQRAVDCVAQSGSGAGKEVRVFAGTYDSFGVPPSASGSATGGYLVIKANGTVDSYDAVQVNSTGIGGSFIANSHHVQFEGMIFDGLGNQPGSGIDIVAASFIRIINNTIRDTTGNCIAGGGENDAVATDWEIIGNHLHHCGLTGFGHGMYIRGFTQDVLIDNNLIEDIPGWGLHLYGIPSGFHLARFTISNNVVRRNKGAGIGCMGFADITDQYCDVFNNTITDNTGLAGIVIVGVPNASVYNNTLYGNTGGITHDYTDHFVAKNNIIDQSGDCFYKIVPQSTNINETISDNMCGTQ
jgi:Right handed beta helix region